MLLDFIRHALEEDETKYFLKWIENDRGELYERESVFSADYIRGDFIRDMTQIGRMYEVTDMWCQSL